jgi:proteasome lid subunit RPN8/RPN11
MKANSKSTFAQPFLLVDDEVVRRIRQHARSCNTTEICGVLIGQDRDQRIEVTASIEGENADQAGAHVTFTQDTWEHIYAVKDKQFPNERIVGWYHSHPGFGIFLSEHDTFIHENFFSSPGQVAWVFDPHSDEEGCFGWVNGRIERLTRIAVQHRRDGERAKSTEHEPASMSAGAGGVPTEQGGGRNSMPFRVLGSGTEEASDSGSNSLERLVTKVFFSLTLLLLGGLLSWYFLPRPVFIPVVLDPATGRLIDAQTGEVVGQLQPKNGSAEQANPAQPKQPSPSGASGKKGDDAKPN